MVRCDPIPRLHLTAPPLHDDLTLKLTSICRSSREDDNVISDLSPDTSHIFLLQHECVLTVADLVFVGFTTTSTSLSRQREW